MSLTTVTVTWDELDIGQAALAGTVTFALSAPLGDATDGLTVNAQPPRSYRFSSGTGTSDPLVANDNANLPAGSYYTITVSIAGQQPYTFTAAINHANGATQTVGYLLQNQLQPTGQFAAYLPLAGGTMTGPLVLAADPAVSLGAATKEYVDDETARAEGVEATLVPQGSDGHVSASYMPRPALYAPTGLRRFRAAAGDSLFTQIPVVCVGDSITAGQGGDNNTATFSNVPDNSNGWAGQLRALFAAGLGSYPGEGFIFADDSRVTWAGGTFSNNYACVPLRHGPRLLHGSGNTLALTVPNGVTLLGVIQANETQAFNSAGSNLADVSALYSQAGSVTVTNQPVTTLTNTGLPVETDIACQPGDVITISAPATAQSYIAGFNLKNANPGVLVHRVGQPGYVSGDMLGGQTTGVLAQSSASQQTAERACYYWAGSTGLIVVSFATNDQSGQASTGSAGGVTLALYTAWMEQFCSQAVADGWCVLIKGDNRNPNAYSGGSSLDQYQAAMKAFALVTDHVAYIDVGELWGSAAAATALSLTNSNSVHPLRRGHGDIARTLYRVLAAAGITELVAA